MSVLDTPPITPPITPPVDGGGTPPVASWRDSLPEDIRGEASFQKFLDPGALAKSYLHLERMQGADKIPLPGKHATDDDWKNVYKKLGLPETLDKYEMDVGKDAKLDPAILGKFKEAAHKAGVLPKQAVELAKWFDLTNQEALAGQDTARKAEEEKGVTALRQEWGQGWDKKVQAAQTALAELKDTGLAEEIKKLGLDNNPVLIKALSKIGESFYEDKLRGEGGSMGGMTPADAQKEINKVMGESTHPYWNVSHPNHRAATEDMAKLYGYLNP